MADQQMAAIWPAPPPFYKHFTKANTARFHAFCKHASQSTTHPPAGEDEANQKAPPTSLHAASHGLETTSLPPELRHLLPPPPPRDDKYKSFGTDIDLHAAPITLASAGVEQLFPASDSASQNPQPYLLALSRSLLTKFLELAGVLSRDPTQGLERTQDLRTMMNNLHFLINQYRPHQARETMILLFEERIARLRDEVGRVQAARKKVQELLEGMGRLAATETGAVARGTDGDGDTQMALQPVREEKEPESDEKHADSLALNTKQKVAWAALQRLSESSELGSG
nr:mediator of rna polymerase ii transcription subunit 7 [Quercus suber]